MKSKKNLIEGEDYYISEKGYWIFTEKYHLDRGRCCNNNCLHCPYKNPGRNIITTGENKKKN